MSKLNLEHLQNPDELLAFVLRVERVETLKEQIAKVDNAIKYMTRMQEHLGDTAANHFVPKDYTKVKYEALASEPTPKKLDAYEQALAGVAESSKNTVDQIDAELARMLVEQSLQDADYVAKGIDDLQDFANSSEVSNVG